MIRSVLDKPVVASKTCAPVKFREVEKERSSSGLTVLPFLPERLAP